MKRKFKAGDRVYHKNLKEYGIFIGYTHGTAEECEVNFETNDRDFEWKQVSESWLELANNIMPVLAASGKPIEYNGSLVEFSR